MTRGKGKGQIWQICSTSVLVCVLSILGQQIAWAQSGLVGTVKDTSGAVLPGVTVEAASDVLIEKVKSATTDGDGSYRISDLRPGTYVVTFTMQGFNTFRREVR